MTKRDRLSQLLDERRRLDAEIVSLVLHNVQATAAATTVAGYETLRRQLDQLLAGSADEQASLLAHMAALRAEFEALRQDVRALAARRGAGLEEPEA